MGLICWYPLNGDLKNKGITDNDLTIQGTADYISISNEGKIGQCYKFTRENASTYAYLESNEAILLPQTHSMFCWVCPESLTSNSNLDAVLGNHVHNATSTTTNPTNTGITLKYKTASTYSVSLNTASGAERTYGTYVGDTILNINEWHHIGFTFDGTTIKIYVDGKVDKTIAFNNKMNMSAQKLRIFSWSNTHVNAQYVGQKRINDVRIYDHTLSAAEVKNIYQTCVCHFNFEDVIVPYKNTKYNDVPKTYNNSYNGIKATASLVKLEETFEGGTIYRLTMSTSDPSILTQMQTELWGHGIHTSNARTFQPNIPVSYGVLYRLITHSDVVVGGYAKNRYTGTAFTPVHYKDNWYRVGQSRLNETTTAGTDNFFTSFYCPSLKLNEEVVIDFCCQEEYEGINYLPEKTHYSKEAELTIYDNSGYGNDATIIEPTKVKFVKSEMEGKYLFNVNHTDYTVRIPHKIFYDNINQCHTVSFWHRKTRKDTERAINFNNSYYIQYNSTSYRSLCYINGGTENDCYVYGAEVPLSEWTFITWVFDHNNEILKVYYNGVLNATSAFSNISGRTPAGFQPNTNLFHLNGDIDDFRIYATALTTEDIKQLYESRAKIDKDGNILSNNFNEESIFDRENLIYNGMLELESTDGFQLYTSSEGHTLEYDPTDSFRGSKGCLKSNNLTIVTKNLIPIYRGDTYKLEFDIKFEGTPAGYKYVSLIPLDQTKQHVDISSVLKTENTDTTLAQELKNGDTKVYLTNGLNWQPTSAQQYLKYLGICDYSYAGYERARLRKYYTDLTDNTLTLQSAWTGGTIPAGTKVANFNDGGVEYYLWSIASAAAPQEWTHKEYTFTGAIRKFAQYMKFGIIWANNPVDGVCMKITNIKLTNTTKHQTITSTYDKDIQNINKQYMVNSNEFNEMGMPIRYIRDYCGGNDKNSYAHFVEIQAINKVGNNIALGKTVTSNDTSMLDLINSSLNIITNGETTGSSSSQYVDSSVALNEDQSVSVTVDLGFIEDIEYVIIHHYHTDSRTYKNTKTEVSADGINWYTIFDSVNEGTYMETYLGHTIYLTPQKCSLYKTGKTYMKELIEI